MGVVVEVGAAGVVVEEPRLVAVGHAVDEGLGVGAPLLVELGEHRDGDLLHVLELAAAGGLHEAGVERLVLHPVGAGPVVDDLREEVRVAPLGVHVRHGEEAVEVVEAHVLGLRLHVLAQVPLAHGLGDVALFAEQLGQGDLALEAAALAVHGRTLEAVAHGEPAREQGGARRGARGLGVGRREPQAASGEGVDVGCGCADGDAAAVAAEVAPAHVVHEDHHDVRRPPAVAVGPPGESLGGHREVGLVHEARLAVVGERRGRAGDRIEVHVVPLVVGRPTVGRGSGVRSGVAANPARGWGPALRDCGHHVVPPHQAPGPGQRLPRAAHRRRRPRRRPRGVERARRHLVQPAPRDRRRRPADRVPRPGPTPRSTW